MSTLNDILKAVRDVVVMNERVAALNSRVDRLEATQLDLRERIIRIETFIDIGRELAGRRELPPPSAP